MPNKNTFIISVGGSLIAPQEGIACDFLKKFRQLILNQVKKGSVFYLIAGGGSIAREYITAADKILEINDHDRDWLGIHATRLNAHLLRTIFRDEAHAEIITNPTIKLSTQNKIIIGSGWKPGWSTDYVATLIAKKYKVKTVINLSNIEYAYDKDPKKFSDAQKLENVDWKKFRKIVGNKWTPGLNMPFDPIASQKAQQLNLKVIIAGKNLNNLQNILEGKGFKGTIIE
jgi:uridylate kinase